MSDKRVTRQQIEQAVEVYVDALREQGLDEDEDPSEIFDELMRQLGGCKTVADIRRKQADDIADYVEERLSSKRDRIALAAVKRELAGGNEETVEDPQDVRDSQTIVPDWMEKILAEAESKGRKVRVVRKHTPFGSYVMALKVA